MFGGALMSSIMFGEEEKPLAPPPPPPPPPQKKKGGGGGGGGTQSTPSRRRGLFEQVSGGRSLLHAVLIEVYMRREARLERVAQLAQDDALLVTAQLRHSATIRRTRSARGEPTQEVRRARGERHSHYTHSHIKRS